MACIFTLKTMFLPGSSAGGQWELVGFSVNPTGPFGAGGNWPWTNNVNDNPIVDFSDIEQGYYKLNLLLSTNCESIILCAA